MPNYLQVKWSVSRGRETYGYNICTLTDTDTGKRYRCNGGGYDMLGTVFGEWLQEAHQCDLHAIQELAHNEYIGTLRVRTDGKLYGMTARHTSKLTSTRIFLDGACGLESMRAIAKAIGLEVKSTIDRKGNVTGFMVS